MPLIRRFEDLLAWQKARRLANVIYDLTDDSGFSKDYQLKNQIRDAAGSSMHNIAEGYDSGTSAEFIRFLKIARRSASEVQSELYLALDRKYITQNELKCFLFETKSSCIQKEINFESETERNVLPVQSCGHLLAIPLEIVCPPAFCRNTWFQSGTALDDAYDLACETKKLINGLIRHLRNRKT